MIASRDNVKIIPSLPGVQATGVLTSDNTNVSNNETVTVGSQTYKFKVVYASGVLTSNNTNVSNNDTVVIGGKTYTFKTTLTDGSTHPGEVKISTVNADGSLTNLMNAINGGAGGGTNYDSSTPVNTVVSSSAVASHALTMTAIVRGSGSNSTATTTTATTLSWGNTTLTGGYDLTTNDVMIDTTADASLTNLAAAINAGAGAGTAYGTQTAANAFVTAGAVAAHAITVTAIAASASGNTVATTETSAHLSWGDTTLDGGDGGATTAVNLDTAGTYYSDAFDIGSYIEAIAFLNVSAHAGTNPTLDIKLQFSHDKNTWVDSGDAFTQVTTNNTLTFKRLTANFGKYMRAVITIGGTTPNYTFDLLLIAKA